MGEALKDEKRQIEKNKRRKAQTKVSKIDMTMNRMETMCDLCENDLSREKKPKASWKQQARDWRRTPARRDNTEQDSGKIVRMLHLSLLLHLATFSLTPLENAGDNA
ncbi:hypothetical protein RUM44_002568 [Polyplax serrata]|uniref:Uncharacterized protein n=1 Tax=Polyplax serrata TaxID=468196 RepID=A0ABR1AF52_POLSC